MSLTSPDKENSRGGNASPTDTVDTQLKVAESIEMRSIEDIFPSLENDRLYRPVVKSDPDFQGLVNSIRQNGVLDPLVITLDGYIVSGHRRYAAACAAGLTNLPVRFVRLNKCDNPDRFFKLLREWNRQRVKSLDEVLREIAVDIDPDVAHGALLRHRAKKTDISDSAIHGDELALGNRQQRKEISGPKQAMLEAIRRVLEQNRAHLPLSVRQVHYRLLNAPPLRHSSKPHSTYRNDQKSYKDLCDVCARARVLGDIPFDWLCDESRPVTLWAVHSHVGPYIAQETDEVFRSYQRDLMQSQPAHIEIVVEKLGLRTIVNRVAGRYTIPVICGRGYSSIPPRWKLVERFRRSGKDRLIILMLNDFDPEGEDIPRAFARSLRDDFHVDADQITAIKVGITQEQIERFKLEPLNKAKSTSSRYAGFAGQHGQFAYELESLSPTELQAEIERSIDSVIDRGAYNHEIDCEREESMTLEQARRAVRLALAQLGEGGAE